jgi:hypothetical protein
LKAFLRDTPFTLIPHLYPSILKSLRIYIEIMKVLPLNKTELFSWHRSKNNPSPLEEEGRVRGAILEKFPLIPSFSLQGRRGNQQNPDIERVVTVPIFTAKLVSFSPC